MGHGEEQDELPPPSAGQSDLGFTSVAIDPRAFQIANDSPPAEDDVEFKSKIGIFASNQASPNGSMCDLPVEERVAYFPG